MATKRLGTELRDLRNNTGDYIRDLNVNETNLNDWKFTILPSNVPYNAAAFAVQMIFPGNY